MTLDSWWAGDYGGPKRYVLLTERIDSSTTIWPTDSEDREGLYLSD